MLKFFKRRPRRRELEPYRADVSVADTNPELHIRDLRDDPRLRRALGLDLEPAVRLLDAA
jgi:hypothetical protein